MNRFEQLHWPRIIGLGALALIRPLMNMTGVMDGLGRPFGPLFMTALISLAWLLIVVKTRVRQPLLTMVCTGVAYGVFAIVLGRILSPILEGPLTNPIAFMAVLITNAVWGGMVGLVALGIRGGIRVMQ